MDAIFSLIKLSLIKLKAVPCSTVINNHSLLFIDEGTLSARRFLKLTFWIIFLNIHMKTVHLLCISNSLDRSSLLMLVIFNDMNSKNKFSNHHFINYILSWKSNNVEVIFNNYCTFHQWNSKPNILSLMPSDNWRIFTFLFRHIRYLRYYYGCSFILTYDWNTDRYFIIEK